MEHDAGGHQARVQGVRVQVEHPIEVVAKKLHYRGSRFVPRDIFDLIAVLHRNRRWLEEAVDAVPAGARRAADRIERVADRYRATIRDEVNVTTTGAELLEVDPAEACDVLRRG